MPEDDDDDDDPRSRHASDMAARQTCTAIAVSTGHRCMRLQTVQAVQAVQAVECGPMCLQHTRIHARTAAHLAAWAELPTADVCDAIAAASRAAYMTRCEARWKRMHARVQASIHVVRLAA
jgi:hypothetical protein